MLCVPRATEFENCGLVTGLEIIYFYSSFSLRKMKTKKKMRLSGVSDSTVLVTSEWTHSELAGSFHWHLEATLVGHVFFRNLPLCFKTL